MKLGIAKTGRKVSEGRPRYPCEDALLKTHAKGLSGSWVTP